MGLGSQFKSEFVAGLLLVAPLAITVFVLSIAFRWLTGLVNPVVRETRLVQYTANIEIVAQLLAAVLIVVFITLVGFAADRSVGRRAFGGIDRLFGLIPLVSTIYSSVRQVGNALSEGETRYERVVLVEYPREEVYSIGFITGDSPAVAATVAGEPVHNVFVPNSPNPTAGRLVLVPDSRLHETDLSVGRGIRLIVTTGIADTEEEFEEFQRDPDPALPS